MRRFWIPSSLAWIVLFGADSLGLAANPYCAAPAGPNCVAKPRCDSPSCVDRPCRPGPPLTPKEGPPSAPPREGPPTDEMIETGVYVAPPRTGAMQGPMNRMGIEGMSITLPTLKLTTPRIEFPCLFRSRSEAKMVIDEAHAPYVPTGHAHARQGVATREAPQENCEEQLQTLKDKYARLEQQAAELERALERQRGGPPGGSSRGGKEHCVEPAPAPPQPEVDASGVNLRPLPMIKAAPIEVGARTGFANRPVGYVQEPGLLPRHVEAPPRPKSSDAVRRLPAVR